VTGYNMIPMPEFYDPNGHLPEEVIKRGVGVVANAFRRCWMRPLVPGESADCRSLIYGKLRQKGFVVYVRITLDEETEDGVGPIPGALIDAASELEAEPHVIRVHMQKAEQGTSFEYFGYQGFIDSVLSNESEWNRTLLGGKSVSDYFRLVGNTLSTLRLDAVADGDWVRFQILIDGRSPNGHIIDPGALVHSTIRSDVYNIFTCTCGVAECAGIWRGVLVVNEGNLTLWRAYYARGRKIFVFDRTEYRNEILWKTKEAITGARSRKPSAARSVA